MAYSKMKELQSMIDPVVMGATTGEIKTKRNHDGDETISMDICINGAEHIIYVAPYTGWRLCKNGKLVVGICWYDSGCPFGTTVGQDQSLAALSVIQQLTGE
jgi:hypothetical protein